MNEAKTPLFLYAETPLHAGSGTALGAVDLPIQRERMSGLPMVQGSGLKGAFREQVELLLRPGDERKLPALLDPYRKDEAARNDLLWQLFGPPPPRDRDEDRDSKRPPPDPSDYGGAIALLDARLLLFPVRTVWGGWAWLTSPMVLERLARDLELLGWKASLPWEGIEHTDPDVALVARATQVAREASILIEDLEYTARSEKEEKVDKLAAWLRAHALPEGRAYEPFGKRLAAQLAVVADEELRFLAEHATEVVARIRISAETGTVDRGALWSEESLPAESLLWSLAFFTDGRQPKRPGGPPQPSVKRYTAAELEARFAGAVGALGRIRLGGDRTVGRGLVGVRVTKEGAR